MDKRRALRPDILARLRQEREEREREAAKLDLPPECAVDKGAFEKALRAHKYLLACETHQHGRKRLRHMGG